VKCYQRTPGRRFSDPEDFPENIQAMMANYSVRNLLEKAALIGPNTARYVEALLEPHAMRNLRKAMGVIDLVGKHPVYIVEGPPCRLWLAMRSRGPPLSGFWKPGRRNFPSLFPPRPDS